MSLTAASEPSQVTDRVSHVLRKRIKATVQNIYIKNELLFVFQNFDFCSENSEEKKKKVRNLTFKIAVELFLFQSAKLLCVVFEFV